MNRYKLKVGDKVKFYDDHCFYTVQACNDRYIICTRKFMKTVLYTIMDLKENICGTDNLVFGFGYETKDQCEQNLSRLINGEMEISHRNRVNLEIKNIQQYNGKISNKSAL